MAFDHAKAFPPSPERVLARKVGHTEFGGGDIEPQRHPDGSAAELDAGEKARAVHAAAWDEVRGDPGRGVGIAARYERLGQPVPEGGPDDPTSTVNGYIYDAATGTFTTVVTN